MGVYQGITIFLRLTNMVDSGICVFVETEKEMIPFRMAKHASVTLDFCVFVTIISIFSGY